MTIKQLKYYPVVLFLMVSYTLYGQNNGHDKAALKEIANAMKSLKDISYQYDLIAKYPGKQSDQTKGEIYIDNDKKVFFNSCDAFTLIYSQHWFYKADHRNKSLTIINLDKEDKHGLKASVEMDVFGNGAVVKFIDSTVLKYGILKSFQENDDTIQIVLTFPSWMKVKKVSMTFNKTEKILINYTLFISYPTGETTYRTQDITELIACKDFKKIQENEQYREDNYFSINKKVLTVKQYNKYKLYTKL